MTIKSDNWTIWLKPSCELVAISKAAKKGKRRKNTPIAEILCVIDALAVIGNLILSKFKKRGGLDIFTKFWALY